MDRWSAIAGFLTNLFRGQYPYLAVTHLGGQASPMPIMHMIAMPFFLLGDVGYLQVFSFISISLLVLFLKVDNSYKLLFLAIYFLSPEFWYEIAVRSDMISNLFLIIAFLIIIEYATKGDPLSKPILVGCIVGILFCTRGIVVVPFIVYFGAKFLKTSWRNKVLFSCSFLLLFSLVLLPFLFWDFQLFMKYNPFILQANHAPKAVQLVSLILAFYISLKVRDVGDALLGTALVLFFMMGYMLISRIVIYGWDTTIYQHKFDLVYFATVLPFIALGIVIKSKSTQKTTLCREYNE